MGAGERADGNADGAWSKQGEASHAVFEDSHAAGKKPLFGVFAVVEYGSLRAAVADCPSVQPHGNTRGPGLCVCADDPPGVQDNRWGARRNTGGFGMGDGGEVRYVQHECAQCSAGLGRLLLDR